jgi:uncharacterized membrane protein
MDISYDRIAGQSKDRLAAISDGIFGVAMTLLLLELHAPDPASVRPGSEWDLWHAIVGNGSALSVYLMSFITLGMFWIGQQTQINHLTHSDRNLTWLHLAFLFPVTILPFSTRLLTTFVTYRVALLTYWFNIFLLGAFLYACWKYTAAAGLVDPAVPEHIKGTVCRRIVVTQSWYAVGAALCLLPISTYWSIGFIIMLQLNFALSPLSWFSRGKPAATL